MRVLSGRKGLGGGVEGERSCSECPSLGKGEGGEGRAARAAEGERAVFQVEKDFPPPGGGGFQRPMQLTLTDRSWSV
jgi:hypothetical protein